MLKKLFLGNAIFECLGGMVLILNPSILLQVKDQGIDTLLVARLEGVSALFMGIISYQLFKYFEFSPLLRIAALTFMTYHLIIALLMNNAYNVGISSSPGPFIIHFLMAVAFAFVFSREKTKFSE
jgi:hypothetical protein